ncbi:MAG: adenosylmethionine decarboxylase [Polyangiaceae bacterium]
MQTRAKHLLVELHECASLPLNDLETVRALMRRAAQAAAATVVGEAFHRYLPHGVTGVLLLEESHFSVHTWPEAGYAALDFYTCGALDPEPAARVVAAGVAAQRVVWLQVDRGLPERDGALALNRRGAW